MSEPAEPDTLPMLTEAVLAELAAEMPPVDSTGQNIGEDLVPLEERPVVDFQPDLEGDDI